MTDRLIEDVSRAGSALADTASEQLDAMLKELRKPPAVSTETVRVDAATLAVSLLQVVNKIGSLMVEVSKFDLVRRSDDLFRVGGSNTVSTIAVTSLPATYKFYVENETLSPVRVAAAWRDETPETLLDELGAGERRLSLVDIPQRDESNRLALELQARVLEAGRPDGKLVARKTVVIVFDDSVPKGSVPARAAKKQPSKKARAKRSG